MSHPQILDNLLKQMKLFKFKTITTSTEVWCIHSRTVQFQKNKQKKIKIKGKENYEKKQQGQTIESIRV